MLQPDWTVPTHTRRDSYWRQAVTTGVITFLNANGLLSTDKEVVSLVQKSTFSCMMTVKAPSPCHWRLRFQACGAARWRQGCWTAWRRAAQWNKVQTAGNGANQSMGKALRCTRCSFFRRPWPRRSFGARWLCPPPPFSVQDRQNTHSRSRVSLHSGQTWSADGTQSDRFKFNWSKQGKNNTNKVGIYKMSGNICNVTSKTHWDLT